MTQQRGTERGQPHDEARTHRITRAEGPGSPGGFTLPGRAQGLEAADKGAEGSGMDKPPFIEETAHLPGVRGIAPHGTPRSEPPIAPPRASLGHAPAREGNWTCCGVAWPGEDAYQAHLRTSHGGNPAAQGAPGGSGQGTEPRH